jgi:hypothetical protein
MPNQVLLSYLKQLRHRINPAYRSKITYHKTFFTLLQPIIFITSHCQKLVNNLFFIIILKILEQIFILLNISISNHMKPINEFLIGFIIRMMLHVVTNIIIFYTPLLESQVAFDLTLLDVGS